MTGVAVWCGVYLGQARNERLAAEAIAAAGGTVVYDWQVEGLSDPAQPAWLRCLLGAYFFDRIAAVRLSYRGNREEVELTEVMLRLSALNGLRSLTVRYADLKDADYEAIGRLHRLEELSLKPKSILSRNNAAELASLVSLRKLALNEVVISPGGLAEIARLPRLEELSVYTLPDYLALNGSVVFGIDDSVLQQRRVNDDDARAIAKCKSLRKVWLNRAIITDEGIAALCGLHDLEFLSVCSPQITGKALREVKQLKKLTWLGASLWRIDGEDLLELKETPRLIGIRLSGSTDDTVPYVAELKQLEVLRLSSKNQITEASLTGFYGMTNLRQLDLSGSQVNKLGEAAKQLEKALPNCAIKLPKTAAEREAKARFLDMKWGGSRRPITRPVEANQPPAG